MSEPIEKSIAATRDVVANVYALLEKLSQQRSIEPLKQLFWSELNYQRVNEPLSRYGWRETTARLLAEDPLLLATGGNGNQDDSGFPIIYCHMNALQLRAHDERLVVTQLLDKYLDGLFIFSNQSLTVWRFINVKGDDKDARRKLLRRITVGPEERLRTASERIALLDLASIGQLNRLDITLRHDEAFSVEAVTDKFFKEYRYLFKILQIDLRNQTSDDVWAHDYALQFLNRCMFLYFIQRKGWLGGNKEFLHTFWQSYKRPLPQYQERPEYQKNAFFEYWLKVLFFEAFNRKFKHSYDYFPDTLRNILAQAPYLNGGLFSENKLDLMDHTFTISDMRFQQVLQFFERYNFTIAEDSPLDQEVAVDPEMIGRVYESLVNVSTELDERGDAGIFYTPRTEIDLMCRLSLVDYLANHLGEERRPLLYDAVFALEPEEMSSADDALRALDLWDDLYGLLSEVTMIDPACGSGAFLVGMLYILNELQERADRYRKRPKSDSESAYERKKRIIGESLYGVDVMEWAVHVAELRLWLSLIIDIEMTQEELHVRPDPLLPHLTFKVRHGDSLVQEIGGVNFGHMQTTSGISPMLKRQLNKLKSEKAKFYHHDPSCVYRTREAAMQDELQLFRAIIQERLLNINNTLRVLNDQPMQSALVGDSVSPKEQAEARERQKRIADKEQEKRELQEALDALVSPKQVPFVWDIAFVEIFGGDNDGFDIVIGNPPYVRQEQISDPLLPREQVTTENKRAYKRKLTNTIYHDFPTFFRYNPATDKAAHELDAKSDLYVYFYLHGLKLLNPMGTFCFITSNSWLDVGYGADLQEFLLNYCHVKMILDNQGKRSFATADVNTIIALFSAPAAKFEMEVLRNITHFVMFKVNFEQILEAEVFKEIERARERIVTDRYRVYPISQQALLEDGTKQPSIEHAEETAPSHSRKGTPGPLVKESQAVYDGNKWGGKYLRAPAIYWTILEKGRDKLVRLGDIAEVRFGIKTGANEFFYLDEVKARQWKIEDEFLQPVIKSPKECKSILIDPSTLKFRLFFCHKSKAELRGTAALAYIEWGEKQAYNKRPSCENRQRWWDLGIRRTPKLGFNYLIDSTARTLYALNGCNFSDNFQEVGIANQLILPLCASLNSTVFQLMVNVAGRANFGDVLLKIQTYEVSDLLCVNPTSITFTDSNIFISTFWDVLSPSVDRRNLDKPIFDVLGLTQGERDAVYEAVIELVESRLKKASSLDGKRNVDSRERKKRLEAVERTLGIWMGLPEEENEGEEEVENCYA